MTLRTSGDSLSERIRKIWGEEAVLPAWKRHDEAAREEKSLYELLSPWHSSLGSRPAVLPDRGHPSDEGTRKTRDAHLWALELAGDQFDENFDYESIYSSLRVLLPTDDGGLQVVEVKGQSTVTGHGRTGSHPARIAFLRSLDIPVLVVYVDGHRVDHGYLHRLPTPIGIDNDPAHRRVGWYVRDMENGERTSFRFPTSPPDVELAGKLFVT